MNYSSLLLAMIFVMIFPAYSTNFIETQKSVLDRKVSIEAENASMIKIARLIEKQEGITTRFILQASLSEKIVPKINAKNQSLGNLLRLIRKTSQVEILITDKNGKNTRLPNRPDEKTGDGGLFPSVSMIRIVKP